MRQVWSVAQASERTGVSPKTIRRAITSGKIEGAFKDASGAWKIPVEGLLAAGYKPSAPAPDEPAPTPTDQSVEVIRLQAELRVLRAELDAAKKIAQANEHRALTAENALRLLEPPPAGMDRGGHGVDSVHGQGWTLSTPEHGHSPGNSGKPGWTVSMDKGGHQVDTGVDTPRSFLSRLFSRR